MAKRKAETLTEEDKRFYMEGGNYPYSGHPSEKRLRGHKFERMIHKNWAQLTEQSLNRDYDSDDESDRARELRTEAEALRRIAREAKAKGGAERKRQLEEVPTKLHHPEEEKSVRSNRRHMKQLARERPKGNLFVKLRNRELGQ